MNQEEDFDKRQREVRETNNTAQAVFEDKMIQFIAATGSGGKNINEIQIPVALSGSLNFSRLPIPIKIVLSKIKKLSFVPGEITDVQGWGVIQQLEELNLSNQLLTELDIGLKERLSWKVLNVEGNGIREIKWQPFLNLVNANFSYNRFVRMGVVPKSLEILDVRNNRLEMLDLSHGARLRYINSSNNTSTMVLIPPPYENTDYELIQTSTSPFYPITETEKTDEPGEKGKKGKEKKREDITRNMDYQEGLKEYFRYRAQYEQTVSKKKYQLWKKYRFGKNGSLSLARQMLSRYVPSCLNCQQSGGMIFQFLPEENKYKGLCGASHPCPFRIEIYRSGNYIRLTDIIEEEYRSSEDCKQSLITQKQDILFGYVDELSGLKKSKKILEECNETSETIKYLEKQHARLYDSERRRRIDDLTLQIGQWITQNKVLISPETVAGTVSDILARRHAQSGKLRGSDWEEEMVEEEEKGLEEERLRMVVESEICNLFPLVQKLRKETYDVMVVEPDEEKEGCRLIQEKIAFSQGEYNLDVEPPAVVAFYR
jgi:hypothetical protein